VKFSGYYIDIQKGGIMQGGPCPDFLPLGIQTQSITCLRRMQALSRDAVFDMST